MTQNPSLLLLRAERAGLCVLRWPLTFWPRWTRVDMWIARRMVDVDRRFFGWDDDE